MLWFLDIPTLLTFLTAGIVLNLTPGNDVVFTLATTLRQGTAAGLLAGLGITLGSLFHTVLAALGLAALLKTNPNLYDAIRWAGAAYLMYLAYQTWRTTSQPLNARTGESPFLRGFITNILNPKVALFMLAFLPQFTDPAKDALALQILSLGLIFATSGLFVISGYALLAGSLRPLIQSHSKTLNRISAVIFGGLAARLVIN